MALKGIKAEDTISVYDPNLKACHEISAEELRLQMKSLGLTDHEVEEKIKKLRKLAEGGGE